MLNPDKSIVEAIKKRLKITDGYCPCVPEEIGNDEFKCPCTKFKKEKVCCCGLFI